MKRLIIPILAFLLCAMIAQQSLAVVDLLYPADNNFTSNTTMTFEYYASVSNLTGCSATVNGNGFHDTDAQSNAMNNVQIQGLSPGTYLWNITCSGLTTESSVTRRFTIDTQAPTLVLVSPLEGTQKQIGLDIIPNDDTSSMLNCVAIWKDEQLDTFKVAKNTHYVKNYTASAGNGTLKVTCSDDAGNTVTQQRPITVVPDFNLLVSLDNAQYGLGEPAKLTIDTINGANVSIDICPDQTGFVQCTTALLGSSNFPQTITLPYMNKTGAYLVEGVAHYAGQTKVNQTRYNVTNSITATIQKSATPKKNSTINLTANIGGGIAPYHVLWKLHDGTTQSDVSVVSVHYADAGTFTEFITVTDQAGNTKSLNTTVVIDPQYSVMIKIVDNETGAPIKAELDIDDIKGTAGTDGIAYFTLQPGTYQIFVSAPGYQYTVEKRYVNSTDLLQIAMGKSLDAPKVTLTSPTADAVVGSPTSIQFTVEHRVPVTCTLFTGKDSWFQASGSMNVSDASPKEFSVQLPDGQQSAKVECAEGQRVGSSAIVAFSVQSGAAQQQTATQTSTTAPTTDEIALQQTVDALDAAISATESFGPKEKEVSELIQFDKAVRNAKKQVQQAIRDVSDLQFRNDLSDEQRTVERKRIIDAVNAQMAAVPVALSVEDTKTFVKYVKEDQIEEVATSLAGLGGLPKDASSLEHKLLPDQQKFTVSTKVMQLQYTYLDGTTKPVTAVTRAFTFAPKIESDYQVYEIIPKEVAKSAREITLLSKAEVLNEDPVLRFPMQESITYVLPHRVDFARVEDVKTVLARPYPESTNVITGFAIFEGGDIGGVSIPLIVLVALIILAYLAYYFNLGKQLKFIMYKLGRKEKVHYLRVLINDALDNLSSNNYEKADMLYKEIRLTYDTLPVPAKNDLYEDIINLVKRMDSYYFNMIMIELDTNLKAGAMDAAIRSYEKLTGTFERLDIEQQHQLVATVSAMAKRVGLGVAA